MNVCWTLTGVNKIVTTQQEVTHVAVTQDTFLTTIDLDVMVCIINSGKFSLPLINHDIIADQNECNSNATNGCQQVCANTLGSYTCECIRGYRLNDDGMSCTGESNSSSHKTLYKISAKISALTYNLFRNT